MRDAVSTAVLFTDLVDSTASSSRLGAEAADGLRRTHFGLLRGAVEAHGGREVKNLGDGLMVAFSGVGAALEAAVAMQQAIDRHNRQGGEPLAVRIGVAVGDAVEEDGDLFGEPVVVAARLCAAADGGTILVPELVRHLAPRGAFEFAPVGELELKGLPEPVATASVGWEPAADDEGGGAVEVARPARLAVPPPSGFVGRAAEREQLTDARKAATAGERRGVLIAGEAGIGKTRLVTEVAADAHRAGAVVLYGRCDEELAIPYQPWVEALSHYAANVEPQVLARHDPMTLAELGRLVPQLLQLAPDLPPPTSADPATERHLLFGAVIGLLGEIAREQLCVVVLDDLHWADRTTVQLLRQVLSALDLGAVLVIATYRDTDLGADHPLTEALAALHREPGVDLLSLHGLGDTEVIALFESIAGHDLTDDGVALAHAVRTETGGNPFFVGEVLRHLAETGAIERRDGRWVAGPDLTEVGLPASVRAVVGQRVRRLGDTAHQVLVTAAVAGRDFDLDIVATVARLDEDQVLDALDAATTAGLVAETTTPDRFTFTHALVQHTLYDELTVARRVRLHQRIAEALEARLGDDPGERIGELATHWLAATRPTELDKAATYARRAGDRAMGALAFGEAAHWYTQALEALDHHGDADPRQRVGLLIALGRAADADQPEGGIDPSCQAGELAHQIGADDLLVEAALNLHFARMGAVDDRIIRVVELALEAVGADVSSERARLTAMLAHHLHWADPDRSIQLHDESVAMARQVGDPDTLMLVARFAGFGAPLDRLTDRLELTSAALDLAVGSGDPNKQARVAISQLLLAFPLGDRRAIEIGMAHLDAAAELSGETGDLWWRCVQRGRLTHLAGDVDAAEALAAQALDYSTEPTYLSLYGVQLISIRFQQGRIAELVETIEHAAAENPKVPGFQAASAWALAHTGQLDLARERLADVRARVEVPWDRDWANTVWLLAETTAVVGDVEAADDYYRQLIPWAHLWSTTVVTVDGPISHTLGLLAETLGRADEAVGHLQTALEMGQELDAPFHTARAQLDLGQRRADRDLVEEALATARRHGYGAIEAQARVALDDLD